MKIHHLRSLIEVAEAGSVRAAARAAGLSQPALSKNLAALESQLDVPLVSRTARGVQLTRYGQALLARARRVDSELRRAAEEIDAMRSGTARGTVSVGVSPAAAVTLVPAAIGGFARRHPDAQLRIVDALMPLALPLLRDGAIDLLVGPVPAGLPARDLAAERLYLSEVFVVVRKGHPLERAKSIRELADAQWVNWGPPDGPGGVIAKAFAAARLGPPRFAVTTESFLALQSLLARTDFVGVLPGQVLAAHSHSLVALALKERVPSVTVGIVTRADSELAPLARAFGEELKRATAALRRAG